MYSIKKIGRIIGIVFLIQFVMGVLINLYILGPIVFDPDYLTKIIANSNLIIATTLLRFLLSSINIGVAIMLLSIFQKKNRNIAIGYLSFSIIGFTVGVLDNTIILSLLSLSESFTTASSSDISNFQRLGDLFYEIRFWTHMIDMLVGSLFLSTLYYLFYVSKLIPRILSTLGFLAVVIMTANIIWAFFGEGLMILYLPIGLTQLCIAIWLIIKGFNSNQITS
ncbi:DUF4386 domain-containing protein [Aquimarina sp. AU474]|uniref:DUF4386 domain-containing protein n=1 Tax=Aquimarina sp. AU474 TaxID=2108529 RepID=UPI000D68759C|nr:DUF4386 domain-containing protein [Aquimarina sp. AU474]